MLIKLWFFCWKDDKIWKKIINGTFNGVIIRGTRSCPPPPRSQKIEKNHKGSLLCFCSNFLNLKKKDSPYDFFENFLPPHFFQKISTTIFKFLPSSLSVDSFLKKLWTIKMDRVTRDKCSWFSWIDLCRMQNFFVKIPKHCSTILLARLILNQHFNNKVLKNINFKFIPSLI